MQELLLVGNPARRRKSRKAASPAQKRARAAFAAAARARSNPAKRRAKRRAAPVAAVHHRRRTVRKHHARARRNPVSSSFTRGITPKLKNAAIGGLGAFGVDVVYGYLQSYLPAAIQSPVDLTTGGINFMYYAAKGAAAIGVGMIAGKMLGANRAAHIADASLTVTAHDLIKHFAAVNLTSVPVAGRGRMGFAPGGKVLPQLRDAQQLRQYVAPNMGEYVGAIHRESTVR